MVADTRVVVGKRSNGADGAREAEGQQARLSRMGISSHFKQDCILFCYTIMNYLLPIQFDIIWLHWSKYMRELVEIQTEN